MVSGWNQITGGPEIELPILNLVWVALGAVDGFSRGTARGR